MMHPEIRDLLYNAEIAYFQKDEIENFQNVIDSLKERLNVYKKLRDQEISIFQPIANQLISEFSDENSELIEHALKHWLAIFRYSAMAMLINDPAFLQHRLLEWLTNIIQAYQIEEIEIRLNELLLSKLKEILPKGQFSLIAPFLEQATATLLISNAPSLAM